MALNFASNVTARQYYSIHGNFGEPDNDFEHEVATGKPASPDISGLSAAEQATINRWMSQMDNSIPTIAPEENDDKTAMSAPALSKVTDYKTYFASAAYKAWRIANRLAKRAQWKWLNADSHDLAAAAVSPSSSVTGSGSGPPGGTIPGSTN